jgi:hypothetical protein
MDEKPKKKHSSVLLLFGIIFISMFFMTLVSSAEGDYTGVSYDVSGAGVSGPYGITQDDTYFWIGDATANEVFQFYLNGTYTGFSFDTGGVDVTGVTQNGTYFWIIGMIDGYVYKYYMNGTYTGDSFDIESYGVGTPYGITQDGTYFWIMDDFDALVYKFYMNGTYTGETFPLVTGSLGGARGITQDGNFFWITSNSDHSIHKYYFNGTDTGTSFNLSEINGVESPFGITQDGTYFLVIDYATLTVYQYELYIPDVESPEMEFINNFDNQNTQSKIINVSVNDTFGSYVSTFLNFNDSICGWWTMDDFDSSYVYDYFGVNDLAITGATNNTDGKFNGSFSFDREAGNYLKLEGDVSKYQTGSQTVSTWIYINSMSANTHYSVYRISNDTSTDDIAMSIERDGSNNEFYVFQIYNGTAFEFVYWVTAYQIPRNTWVNFMGVYDDDTREIFLYINGVLKANKTMVGSRGTEPAGDIYIGNDANIDGGNMWNGSLDDIIIFNRALPQNEILGIYANKSQEYLTKTFTGLAEGDHVFNAFSQDTWGNINTLGDHTLTIDLTDPLVAITNLTTKEGFQTISFNSSASDTYLLSCKYSIFNLTGSIDGSNENVSMACNTNPHSATTTAYGNFTLRVYALDTAGNEVYDEENFTLKEAPAGGGPGGGGGSTPDTKTKETIPVIGLLRNNDTLVQYNDLVREILYAKINSFCSNKETGQLLAIQDYSQECSLNLVDLEVIRVEIDVMGFVVKSEDMVGFFSDYKNKNFFQGYETKENIIKYGLFTSVLGIPNPMKIDPPSLDRYFIISQPKGNITLEYIFKVNKNIKACDIVSDTPQMSCELLTNSSFRVMYYINNTDFFSQIFSGQVSVTSDSEQQFLEVKNVNIVGMRTLNIAYPIFGVIPAWMGIVGLIVLVIIILIIIARIRAKRKRRKKK